MNVLSAGSKLNESRTVTLEIDGENRLMTINFRHHRITDQWTMSVKDERGEDVVTHLPLMSGVDWMTANLLRVFAYKKVGCAAVYPQNEGMWGEDPTKDNLASDYVLVWGDTNEA